MYTVHTVCVVDVVQNMHVSTMHFLCVPVQSPHLANVCTSYYPICELWLHIDCVVCMWQRTELSYFRNQLALPSVKNVMPCHKAPCSRFLVSNLHVGQSRSLAAISII